MDKTFIDGLYEESEEDKINYFKFFFISHKYHITLYKIVVWPFLVPSLLVGIGFLLTNFYKVIFLGQFGEVIFLLVGMILVGCLIGAWIGLGIEVYKRERENTKAANLSFDLSPSEDKGWSFHQHGERNVLTVLEYFLTGNDFIQGMHTSFSNKTKSIKLCVGDFIRVNWTDSPSDVKSRDYLTYLLFTNLDSSFEKHLCVGERECVEWLNTYFQLTMPDGLSKGLRRVRVKQNMVLIELYGRVSKPENKLILAKYFHDQL